MSAADLGKWMVNFFDSKVGDSGIVQRMLRSGVLADGTETGYGAGLRLPRYQEMTLARHEGNVPGFLAEMSLIPEEGFGVAILSNDHQSSPRQLSQWILDACHGAERPIPAQGEASSETPERQVDPATLEAAIGTYLAEAPRVVISLFVLDGHFFGQIEGRPRFKLIPESDSTFISARPPYKLALTQDSDGSVSGFALRAGSAALVASKTAPLSPERAAEYVGPYFSPEVDAEYRITGIDGGLVMRHRWDEPIHLRLIDSDEFSTQLDWARRIRFTRDSSGRITGFLFDGEFLTGLRFDKR